MRDKNCFYKKTPTPEMRIEVGVLCIFTIPEMIKEREFGDGELWNDDREKELQAFLNEISDKYQYDFRGSLDQVQSLYPSEYKNFRRTTMFD